MVIAERRPGPREVLAARILVVDDEAVIRDWIASHLHDEGHRPTKASSGEEALTLLSRDQFDLVVLDVGLPGISGFDTCRQIRARSDVPVIFVTAAASVHERLHGFDLGADDYVIKPMEVRELGRRVQAVLRRRLRGEQAGDVLSGPGNLEMRLRAHEVYAGERLLDLTPKEFAVLRVLLERRTEVLTTDELSVIIWGYETFGSRNFVEAHVSRLRGKLKAAGAGGVVSTVRGIGYVIR